MTDSIPLPTHLPPTSPDEIEFQPFLTFWPLAPFASGGEAHLHLLADKISKPWTAMAFSLPEQKKTSFPSFATSLSFHLMLLIPALDCTMQTQSSSNFFRVICFEENIKVPKLFFAVEQELHILVGWSILPMPVHSSVCSPLEKDIWCSAGGNASEGACNMSCINFVSWHVDLVWRVLCDIL